MILNKLPISVIILTHNEELNIGPCLESVVSWAGEVVVVDSGSSDRTTEIVSQFTDKIYYNKFENYSFQRNWAQDNLPLAFQWLFHVDADERVSVDLVSELQSIFKNGEANQAIAGYLVRRRIEFLGRHIKHGGLYPSYHCRIFQKDRGRCEDKAYDQHFYVNGPILKIEADLIELTAISLSSWTSRHNRWAQMEASYLFKDSINQRETINPGLTGSPIERRRWLKVNLYENGPLFLRSFLYFVFRYFLRCGFLDGVPGLIYHVLHGFWFRFYIDSCYYEMKEESKAHE